MYIIVKLNKIKIFAMMINCLMYNNAYYINYECYVFKRTF